MAQVVAQVVAQGHERDDETHAWWEVWKGWGGFSATKGGGSYLVEKKEDRKDSHISMLSTFRTGPASFDLYFCMSLRRSPHHFIANLLPFVDTRPGGRRRRLTCPLESCQGYPPTAPKHLLSLQLPPRRVSSPSTPAPAAPLPQPPQPLAPHIPLLVPPTPTRRSPPPLSPPAHPVYVTLQLAPKRGAREHCLHARLGRHAHVRRVQGTLREAAAGDGMCWFCKVVLKGGKTMDQVSSHHGFQGN